MHHRNRVCFADVDLFGEDEDMEFKSDMDDPEVAALHIAHQALSSIHALRDRRNALEWLAARVVSDIQKEHKERYRA